MLPDPIIGGIITLIGTFLLLLAGSLGFLYKNRKENAEHIDDVDDRLQSVEQALRGHEQGPDDGYLTESRKQFQLLHERLDDMEDTMDAVARSQEQTHDKLGNKVDRIIRVLHENDINGHLPEESDD